jgi:hypothetical protein
MEGVNEVQGKREKTRPRRRVVPSRRWPLSEKPTFHSQSILCAPGTHKFLCHL